MSDKALLIMATLAVVGGVSICLLTGGPLFIECGVNVSC